MAQKYNSNLFGFDIGLYLIIMFLNHSYIEKNNYDFNFIVLL